MAHPPWEVERLDPDRKAVMQAMLEQAVADERPRRSIIRRPAVAVGLGAAVVLGGGTATAYVLVQRPVTDTSSVHCLARAEMDERGSYPGSSVAVAEPNGEQVSIDDALGMCSQVWRDGLLDPSLGSGNAARPNPERNSAVPNDLTVCVMPDGSAAVVPGPPAACGSVGLALKLD